MTKLRQQMDDDMLARGLADRTRESYLWAVTGLARFYHRSPDQISDAEVQAYLVHLIRERQRAWSTCNIVVNGLRFFYHTTLKRDRTTFSIPSPRQSGKLPFVLSREEVQRRLTHAANQTYRTMLMTAYASGVRLSEVLHLRVSHIDSARMTIRVVQGKGGQDRDTLLSARLLEALRAYGNATRPSDWLFPARKHPARPMDPSSVQKAYGTATRRAGLTKPGGIHTRSHCFATHLLEAGVDLHTIQRLMGHRHLSTTARYLQLARHTQIGPGSPLDLRDGVDAPPREPMCPVAAQAMAAIASLRLTLADLVRAHGDAYRRTHRLATVQTRALGAIAACRTALLGGHRETCDHCGATRLTFNSCRNRHCPTCQAQASARWIEARRAELLPIPYFHVVFTLPHAVNALAQGNPRVMYTLLFRAAADTRLTFGRDPRHLGGTIGVTAILHTWGQTLTQHLHVHCLVTGGALSPDRTRWVRGRATFLFPVHARSVVFRAKYLAGLPRACTAGTLTFAAGTAPLADAGRFAALLAQRRATPWVVYAKRPFGGPAHVLRYLGRYTHRIAIANARLVSLVDGVVRFRWKDYADRGHTKIMALDVDEFLRRFLLHVLPRGFVRIRHVGLLANGQRRAAITRARHLLDAPTPVAPADDAAPTDRDPTLCVHCRQGHWQVVEILRPLGPMLARPLAASAPDTS